MPVEYAVRARFAGESTNQNREAIRPCEHGIQVLQLRNACSHHNLCYGVSVPLKSCGLSKVAYYLFKCAFMRGCTAVLGLASISALVTAEPAMTSPVVSTNTVRLLDVDDDSRGAFGIGMAGAGSVLIPGVPPVEPTDI